MSLTIDSLHYKFSSKFENLKNFSTYLKNILECFITTDPHEKKLMTYADFINFNALPTHKQLLQDVITILSNIHSLSINYDDQTSPILNLYSELINQNETEGKNNNLNKKLEEYIKIITSENFSNKLDYYFNNLKEIMEKINNLKDFIKFIHKNNTNSEKFIVNIDFGDETKYLLQMNYYDTTHKFIEQHEEHKISFSIKTIPINKCECGGNMILDLESSFKRCETCGCEIYMPGTIFDDGQFYNSQGQCVKHKKYDPNRHCERWIKQIQAIEDVSGPAFNEIVELLNKRAIVEYTKDGKLRSMQNMKCNQIREWLKEYKQTTKWNDHAPLLRRCITALHGEAVIPPLLSKDEEERILIDFSQDMDMYEKISKDNSVLKLINKEKIKNKPYYPFGLLKVLFRQLKGDSRLHALIECIHFQSSATNIKNDRIYKIICEKRGIKFEPTDRTMMYQFGH